MPAHGSPIFWVIDIIGRRFIVHRRPDAAEYREVIAYSADEEVAPLARPDAPPKREEFTR